MLAGPGSAALVRLTGNLSHAGLFVALTYLGSAFGAALGGRTMDKFGRKPPLVAAYCVSGTGFTLAGLGLSSTNLPLFITGTLMFAAAFGTINLTRLSAAEMFVPAERGKGVAWIQMSAIFGANVGPLLLLLSTPIGTIIGRDPLSLVWFVAPPLVLTGALLVSTAEEPRRIAERIAAEMRAQEQKQSIPAAIDTKRIMLIGVLTLAASQAAMAAVMGVAGAAVTHAGHGMNVLGWLMLMHFAGMFGLSWVVGRVADRVGRRTTITIGLSLLSLGGMTVALVQNSVGFGLGLLLVGFGWSFGFLGSTVLLADVIVPERRARTMGRADLVSQLTSAVVAVGGGWWFAQHGVSGLGVLALCVAIVPLLLLFLVHEGPPGQYGGQLQQARS